MDAIFYMSVAVPGYLSTLKDTPALVVNRDSLDGTRDDWMMVGRICLWISMVFGFSPNYNPMRNSLYHIVTGTTDFTNKA